MNKPEDLFVFSIDSMSPETLPLARLIQYLQKLDVLFGSKEHVHFIEVRHGSAEPAFLIDDVAKPDVIRRLKLVGSDSAPKDLVGAVIELNQFLREDNAVGVLRASGGAQIVEFPGRLMPADEEVTVAEHGTLEGLLVRLGGKDKTAHATIEIEQGHWESITLSRELAKQLAPYLYGEEIRVSGRGKWKRSSEGEWSLASFSADHFEPVSRGNLEETFNQIAAIKGDTWRQVDDPLEELLRLRGHEG